MKISAKRENVCANISAHNVMEADINGKEKLDVVFGEAAQINVDAAVKYIKSGQKEIDDYVQTSLESAISSKQDVIEDLENIRTGANLGISSVQPADLDISLSQKQETLVSGNNIKTINNQSLLGFGNISINAGVDSVNGKTGDVVLTTSDLTNDSGYVTSSSLATVALSGDYDDLTNTPTVYHPDLLSFQWSDHLLNNVSWLRADTFSWQDGTVYSDAYNHLVDDYTNGTRTLVREGAGIWCNIAPDGHRIVDASDTTQVTNVENLYNESGVAWYYILDTRNQRFKLPRTKYGFVGLRDTVGKYVPESLPNIKGLFTQTDSQVGTYNAFASGALYMTEEARSYMFGRMNGSQSKGDLGFDASRSSSTYQDNAPVQQRATQMYLYFYVGQFSQSATEQTAGLNAELFNSKLDLDAGNATSTTTANLLNLANSTTKELVNGWGIPDYTAGVSISTGYVAVANGMVKIVRGGGSGGVSLRVDGVVADGNYSNTTNEGGCLIAFVKKGSTVTWDTGNISDTPTFFPFVGE